MTDLPDLYRDHEHLVDPAAARLLPAVARRARRHRIKTVTGYGGLAAAVVAVLAGAVVATGGVRHRTSPPAGPTPGPTIAPGPTRVESSLGLEISVPSSWTTNDTGCHAGDSSTVDRGVRVQLACLSPVSPTKETAYITGAGSPMLPEATMTALAAHETAGTLDGHPVRRAAGRDGDGMYVGYLVAPAPRDVAVWVRVRTQATLRAILDSAHLVDVDVRGCPTTPAAPTATGSPLVDPHPASISVCFYGGELPSRLQASSSRTGAAAATLARDLDATRPGRYPDTPLDECLRSAYPEHVDATIMIFAADGTVTRVNAMWMACENRRLYSATDTRRYTNPLLAEIVDGLHLGLVTLG